MDDSLNFQERSVLELLKTQLATLETSATKLDDKAQQNISVSSVIVALVSALQLRPEDELPIGTVSTIFIIELIQTFDANI